MQLSTGQQQKVFSETKQPAVFLPKAQAVWKALGVHSGKIYKNT